MHKAPLAALATTSRSWQTAIEPTTFRELKLGSGDLAMFKQVFCRSGHEYRQPLLRLLWFEVTLAPYSDAACAEYENDKDRANNSAAFSRDVSSLLYTLSDFRANGTALVLRINAWSSTDGSKLSPEAKKIRRAALEGGTRKDISSLRYRNSYLSLDCSLPASVPCVTELLPPAKSLRCMHPADLVSLSGLFPRLKSLYWPFNDPGIYLSQRRQHYKDLGHALAGYRPSRETAHARIQFELPVWRDWQQLPNLAEPFGQDSDCASTCMALRAIIGQSHLKTMLYEGMLDPSFFWDDGTEIRSAPDDREKHTSWNTLEKLDIVFPIYSLSGKWYFRGNGHSSFYREISDTPLPAPDPGLGLAERAEVGELMPPGYGTNDGQEDEAVETWKTAMAIPVDDDGLVAEGAQFRDTPSDSTMQPLLRAVARRLAHGAPSLGTLDLRCKVPAPINKWIFSFCAPGHTSAWVPKADSQTKTGRPRVFFQTGGWRPDAGTMGLLRDIGRTRFGIDTAVIFLPQRY